MLKSFTGVKEIIEVDDFSKGLILKNIPSAARIKVDRSSDKIGDTNIFPEMSVAEFVQLFQQILRVYPFVQETAGIYAKVNIPFSTLGVLTLDDSVRYVVTITNNTDTNEVEVYNWDSVAKGSPIRIQRADVRGSLSEKNEDVKGIEYLYFPNGLPEKLELYVPHGTDQRKVVLSKTQMEGLGVQTVVGKLASAYVYANEVKVISVSSILKDVRIHTLGNGTDFTFYKIDVL